MKFLLLLFFLFNVVDLNWIKIDKDNTDNECIIFDEDKTVLKCDVNDLTMKPENGEFQFQIAEHCNVVTLLFNKNPRNSLNIMRSLLNATNGTVTIQTNTREVTPAFLVINGALELVDGMLNISFVLGESQLQKQCDLKILEGVPMKYIPVSSTPATNTSKVNKTVIIVPSVIGGIVIIAIVVLLIWWCCFRNKKNNLNLNLNPKIQSKKIKSVDLTQHPDDIDLYEGKETRHRVVPPSNEQIIDQVNPNEEPHKAKKRQFLQKLEHVARSMDIDNVGSHLSIPIVSGWKGLRKIATAKTFEDITQDYYANLNDKDGKKLAGFVDKLNTDSTQKEQFGTTNMSTGGKKGKSRGKKMKNNDTAKNDTFIGKLTRLLGLNKSAETTGQRTRNEDGTEPNAVNVDVTQEVTQVHPSIDVTQNTTQAGNISHGRTETTQFPTVYDATQSTIDYTQFTSDIPAHEYRFWKFINKFRNALNIIVLNLYEIYSGKIEISYLKTKNLDTLKNLNLYYNLDHFEKLGAPMTNNEEAKKLLQWDNIYNYFLSIGVITYEAYLMAAYTLAPCGPRLILDAEIKFLVSPFDEMMEYYQLLIFERQKFLNEYTPRLVKKKLYLGKISRRFITEILNTNETSEFHTLCILSFLYHRRLTRISIKQINRVPLQVLILMLLSNNFSEKKMWKIFYRIRELVANGVKDPDIKKYKLSYPMNLVVWLSEHFEFNVPEKPIDDNGNEVKPIIESNRAWFV